MGGAHKISLKRKDRKTGELARQSGGCLAQKITRNVERHIGCWLYRSQQKRRLNRAARAEFHHCPRWPNGIRKFASPRLQNRCFTAGRIIFGKLGNSLKQIRACAVIEPPRWNGFALLGKPCQNVSTKGSVNALLVEIDQRLGSLFAHPISFASLRPVNCQR